MTILEAEKIRMPFGFYGRQGLTLGEIAADDVLYLDWLAGRPLGHAYLKEAIGVLAQKHEHAIAAAIHRGDKPKIFDRDREDQAKRPVQGKLF